MRRWSAFMDQYFRGGRQDQLVHRSTATVAAKALVHVLKQCGDEVTRENVMRQAASMRDVEIDVLLPGIKMNTAANDFFPLEQLQDGPLQPGQMGAVRPGDERRGRADVAIAPRRPPALPPPSGGGRLGWGCFRKKALTRFREDFFAEAPPPCPPRANARGREMKFLTTPSAFINPCAR
jgi:hypothetical protein